jgi:hypothetical protein
MLFKSALITSASGSAGGLTASHNRGGQYFRARTVPTNPSSERQQTIRERFAYLSDYWSETLTAAQRTGWSAYAPSVKLPNALGDTGSPTGQQAFMRTNLVLLEAGEPVRAAAPGTLGEASPIIVRVAGLSLHDSTSGVPNALIISAITDLTPLTTASLDGINLYVSESAVAPGVEYTKGLKRLFVRSIRGDEAFPLTVTLPTTIAAASDYMLRMVHFDLDGRVSPETVLRHLSVNVP